MQHRVIDKHAIVNLHACKLIYIGVQNKSSLNYIFFQFLDFVIRYLIGNSHVIFCAFWDIVIRLLS